MQKVEEIPPKEALNAIANGALLLDVREQYELDEIAYDVGNFAHIPLGEIQDRIDEIPKDRVVIIACRSGQRSMNVSTLLATQGYDNVKNLKGGIIAWEEDGAPTR